MKNKKLPRKIYELHARHCASGCIDYDKSREFLRSAKVFYTNKVPHCLDGPAIYGPLWPALASFPAGTLQEWWTFGLPHKLDGPAFECNEKGYLHYSRFFLHGIVIGKDDYLDITKSKNPVTIACSMLYYFPPYVKDMLPHIRKMLLNVHGLTSQELDGILRTVSMTKSI